MQLRERWWNFFFFFCSLGLMSSPVGQGGHEYWSVQLDVFLYCLIQHFWSLLTNVTFRNRYISELHNLNPTLIFIHLRKRWQSFMNGRPFFFPSSLFRFIHCRGTTCAFSFVRAREAVGGRVFSLILCVLLKAFSLWSETSFQLLISIYLMT